MFRVLKLKNLPHSFFFLEIYHHSYLRTTIPLCFLGAFLLTENDLSKEKLYTQCATRFYDLIDGFSCNATRSTLRLTASCFFFPPFYFILFFDIHSYIPPVKYSLSLSLLKFFSLLFYTFGILVVAKGGRKLTLIFKTVRRIFPLLCCVKNLIPCSFKNYSNKIKQRFFFKISMLKRIFNFYDERRSHLLVIKCHPEKKKN